MNRPFRQLILGVPLQVVKMSSEGVGLGRVALSPSSYAAPPPILGCAAIKDWSLLDELEPQTVEEEVCDVGGPKHMGGMRVSWCEYWELKVGRQGGL